MKKRLKCLYERKHPTTQDDLLVSFCNTWFLKCLKNMKEFSINKYKYSLLSFISNEFPYMLRYKRMLKLTDNYRKMSSENEEDTNFNIVCFV